MSGWFVRRAAWAWTILINSFRDKIITLQALPAERVSWHATIRAKCGKWIRFLIYHDDVLGTEQMSRTATHHVQTSRHHQLLMFSSIRRGRASNPRPVGANPYSSTLSHMHHPYRIHEYRVEYEYVYSYVCTVTVRPLGRPEAIC